MLGFKSPKNIIYGGGGRSPEIRFLETLERERERGEEKKKSFGDFLGFINQKSLSPELKFIVSTRATCRHKKKEKKKKRFHRRSKRGDLEKIKVCGLGSLSRFRKSVSYAPRGMDSS